jgi:tRNA (mo5U34)-methyltransferase
MLADSNDVRRRLMEEIRGGPAWYHTIDLGDGLLTPGSYDHRPLLTQYSFPERMNGMRVLDIGASNGFFSFEFERRGADDVVALDLRDWKEHDFPPETLERLKKQGFAERWQRNSKIRFELVRDYLGSRVKKVEMTAYEISRNRLGTFDLVFCGSLLMHLTNPLRALLGMKEVTKGKAIVSTGVDLTINQEGSLARFANRNDPTLWWIPNVACLGEMLLAAGFMNPRQVSTFELNRKDGTGGMSHVVYHATCGFA